jgi:hypothetical protein
MVGAACMGVCRQEAAARLGRKEGLPGCFVVVGVVVVIVVNPRTARVLILNSNQGNGCAVVLASRVPLLLDGKLSYGSSGGRGSGNVAVVVVPSPQILPPGTRAIIKSHLAAINGHLRRCLTATTMIT